MPYLSEHLQKIVFLVPYGSMSAGDGYHLHEALIPGLNLVIGDVLVQFWSIWMGKGLLGGSSHSVIRLFHPTYKWMNPTYLMYNWGYNLLMIHQVV